MSYHNDNCPISLLFLHYARFIIRLSLRLNRPKGQRVCLKIISTQIFAEMTSLIWDLRLNSWRLMKSQQITSFQKEKQINWVEGSDAFQVRRFKRILSLQATPSLRTNFTAVKRSWQKSFLNLRVKN